VEVISDLGFVTLRSYKGETNFVYATGTDIKSFSIEDKLPWDSVKEHILKIRKEHDNHDLSNPSVLFLSPSSKADMYEYEIFNVPFNVKKYHFKNIYQIDNDSTPNILNNDSSLLYDGSNLFFVIERSKELLDYAAQFFDEYGLEYVKIRSEKKMVIQRKIGRTVDQLGFELTPDTFQRMIYHVAAIKSNTNSVLLFEEPESHSFPPYIAEFANQVIDSKTNQFFITTHSPYLLDSFLQDESIAEELNIVLTWFENYETKIRVLSEEEIKQIFGNGIDIFFSIDKYITKSK
jgi:hypothetical protein